MRTPAELLRRLTGRAPRLSGLRVAPEYNTDIFRTHPRLGPESSFRPADLGFGRPVAPGFHDTDQFAFEPIFHARMEPALRWYDSAADAPTRLVYAPFYLGISSLPYAAPEREAQVAEAFLSLAHAHPGKLFLLPFSRAHVELLRLGIVLPENVILLTHEKIAAGHRAIAVPYATGFHPATADEAPPPADRPVRGALIANWRKGLRERLMAEFRAAEGFVYQPIDVYRDRIGWVPTDDALRTTLELRRQTVLAVEPPGDTPSRRSLYESLYCGCIPVVFPAHGYRFPFEDRLDWSRLTLPVFLRQKGFVSPQVAGSFETLPELLAAVPDALIADKTAYIGRHRARLHYAMQDAGHDAIPWIFDEVARVAATL